MCVFPHRFPVAVILLALIGISCRQPKEASPESASADSMAIEPMGIRVAAICFRSPHSVLLGPPTRSGRQGKGPGWLGLQVPQNADSGWAKLVDAGSKTFHGFWRRDASDSVAFAAGDDFLQLRMRLAVSDTVVIGSALVRSDAALEPDASGRLAALRREWTLRAVRVPCATMPAGW